MGLFDKLKGAMNAVTGGAAKVTIQYQPPGGFPGDTVQVRITATSTGGEVKSGGVFVDLRSVEKVHVPAHSHANVQVDVHLDHETFKQSFQVAPPFVLGAGQTSLFEGAVQIPPTAQPTYQGRHAQHAWEIRGRVEAFGNDPDSGYQPFMVGKRN